MIDTGDQVISTGVLGLFASDPADCHNLNPTNENNLYPRFDLVDSNNNQMGDIASNIFKIENNDLIIETGSSWLTNSPQDRDFNMKIRARPSQNGSYAYKDYQISVKVDCSGSSIQLKSFDEWVETGTIGSGTITLNTDVLDQLFSSTGADFCHSTDKISISLVKDTSVVAVPLDEPQLTMFLLQGDPINELVVNMNLNYL